MFLRISFKVELRIGQYANKGIRPCFWVNEGLYLVYISSLVFNYLFRSPTRLWNSIIKRWMAQQDDYIARWLCFDEAWSYLWVGILWEHNSCIFHFRIRLKPAVVVADIKWFGLHPSTKCNTCHGPQQLLIHTPVDHSLLVKHTLFLALFSEALERTHTHFAFRLGKHSFVYLRYSWGLKCWLDPDMVSPRSLLVT